MSKVKVVLNSKEIESGILKSKEVKEMLKEITDGIKSRCGDGYESDVVLLDDKYVSSVYTDTFRAMADCRKNNTLLKGLEG